MQSQGATLSKWNDMKNTISRFESIVFFSDLHGVRVILGFSELVWALTLLWPGETFGRPTYNVMSQVMSEEAWGFLFLASSFTQFGIVFRADYHSKFATYFAGWNMCLWLYVVISMYLSVTPPPAAISGEFGLAFSAGWVWIRTGYACHSGRRRSDIDKDLLSPTN